MNRSRQYKLQCFRNELLDKRHQRFYFCVFYCHSDEFADALNHTEYSLLCLRRATLSALSALVFVLVLLCTAEIHIVALNSTRESVRIVLKERAVNLLKLIQKLSVCDNKYTVT